MKKYVLLFCIISLIACENRKEEKKYQKEKMSFLKVDPTNNVSVNFSDIFDDIYLIQLETNNESLLGGISEIVFKGNKFFIRSGGKKEAILIFTIDGSFINSIGKKGRGPGEYLHLQDFHVDSLTNNIEVLDSEGRKILYYDETGNYIDYWKTNLFSLAFTKIDSDTYAFYCGNDLSEQNKSKVNIISKSKNITIAQHFPIQLNQAKFLNLYDLTNFAEYSGQSSFLYGFNDTIFQFKENSLKPRLLIDFGFMYLDKLMHVYYSKRSGKIIVADKLTNGLIFNSFESKTSFENLPKGNSNSSLFYVIEPYDFIATVDSLKSSLTESGWQVYKNEHNEVIEIYENLSIDDNPILAIRKTKAF